MKLKYTYIFLVGILIWAAISSNSTGMGNTQSDCASCHKGSTGTTTLDSLVFIDQVTGARTNSSYVPGRAYTVSIYGKNINSLSGYGFQVNNRGKGTFSSIPFGTTIADSIWGHSTTLTGTAGAYTQSIQWTAPAAGAGAITFKSILCAVNSNNDTSGDASSALFTKTLSETILVAGANIISTTTSATCARKVVTYICTPTNGGTSPTYDWQINGVSQGVNSDTFRTSTLVNGVVVSCKVTSSLSGVVGSPVTSNLLTANITPNYMDSVVITPKTVDTVCAGASKTFIATPSAGVILPRYQWYLNGVAMPGKTNATLVQTGFNNNDQFSCKMIVSNPCPFYDTAVSNIKTIRTKPSPSFAFIPDQKLCNGEFTSQIIALRAPASTKFNWTNSKTSIGLAASGKKDTIPAFKAVNLGTNVDTAILTFIDTNAGCTNYPATMRIIVNPTPKTFVPKSLTLCANVAQAALPITSNVSGANILWTNTNTSIGLDPSGNGSLPAFTTINNTLDSSYSYILAKSIFNSCTGPDTLFKITVYPLPILNKIDSVVVCNGVFVDTAKFKANIPTASITWSIASNTIGMANSGTTFVPKFKAVNTGTTPVIVNVPVKVAYKTCKGADSNFRVTVQPNKPLTVAISSNAVAEMCFNDTIKFKSTISAGVNNPKYQWLINGNPVAGETKDSMVWSTWAPLDSVSLMLSSDNVCLAVDTIVSLKKTTKIHSSVIPAIAMFSKDSVCSGTSLAFTTKDTLKGLSPVYKWMKNSTVVGTTNAFSSSTLANGDTITCYLTSSFSCATPKTVMAQKIITVIPSLIPTVTIAKNKTKICSGDTVTFTPTVTNGGTAPKYSWKFNGKQIDTFLNSQSFVISKSSDIVNFTMISSYICAKPSTVTVNATMPTYGSLEGITLTPTLIDTFCYSDSALVKVNTNIAGLNYKWNTGQTAQSFYSKSTQSYMVTVTESLNNCSAIFGPVTTHRNPLQLKPTITLKGDRLEASYAANYIWIKNGTIMAGQTASSIVVSGTTDKYRVIAYNYGSCSDTSEVFDMAKLSIDIKGNSNNISIYPMPITQGIFTIDFNTINDKNIEIYNLSGEKVIEINSNDAKVKVNMSTVSKGIYLLKATLNNEEYTHKIILE